MTDSGVAGGGLAMTETQRGKVRGQRYGRWYAPSEGGYSAVDPQEAEYVPYVERTPPDVPPFNVELTVTKDEDDA